MNLALFTNSFPFMPGEEFLETEVPYLASRFDAVTIYPSREGDTSRQLPDNVKVDLSLSKKIAGFGSPIKSALNLYQLAAPTPARELLSLGFGRLTDRKCLLDVATHWFRARKMAKWLNENEQFADSPPVCYSYWFTAIVTGLALHRRKTPNMKIVSRCHGFDLYKHRAHKELFPFRKLAINNLRLLLPVTNNGRQHLLEDYQAHADKIQVARLGVNQHGTNPGKPQADKAIRICSCSYVTQVKRLHVLANAILKVANQRPETKVYWTHFGDGPLLNKVKSIAAKNDRNLHCDFRGSVSNADILESYKSEPFDAFVNCSSSEGLPVSIMEAMSFGIPTIAPDIGGISELVNNETGRLLPTVCMAEDIADAIMSVATSSNNLRSAAQASWQKTVDAKTNYQKFADMLFEIASEKSGQ